MVSGNFENPYVPTFLSQLIDGKWMQIEPSIEKPDKLQACWTSVMARHLTESNDYCTF